MPAAAEQLGHVAEDLSYLQVAPSADDAVLFEPADPGQRFIAALIDAMIASTATEIFAALLVAAAHAKVKHGLAQVLVSGIAPLYYSALEYNSGQTLGKRVMKIKVLPREGGELLSLGQVLGREFIGRTISIVAFGLGFVGVLYRKDRRTFHDRMFRTRVVKWR